MSSKVTFAKSAKQIATALAGLREQCRQMTEMYVSRGYNSGGSNPISDGDLTSEEVTAADMATFDTLCQHFEKFFTNEAVPTDGRRVIINKLRTDL